MPFILGICEEDVSTLDLPPDVILVRLDENIIQLGQNELPPLPELPQRALSEALQTIAASKGQPTEKYCA